MLLPLPLTIIHVCSPASFCLLPPSHSSSLRYLPSLMHEIHHTHIPSPVKQTLYMQVRPDHSSAQRFRTLLSDTVLCTGGLIHSLPYQHSVKKLSALLSAVLLLQAYPDWFAKSLAQAANMYVLVLVIGVIGFLIDRVLLIFQNHISKRFAGGGN